MWCTSASLSLRRSLETRVQVRPPWAERARGGVEQLDLEAFPLEDALEEYCALNLVPGRIRRVELHVIGEDAHRLVAKLIPVDRPDGLGSGALGGKATHGRDDDGERDERAEEAVHESICPGGRDVRWESSGARETMQGKGPAPETGPRTGA